MKLVIKNREPFRAEQKLSSFLQGVDNHLHLLFCPKGFSVFKGVTKRYLATLSFLANLLSPESGILSVKNSQLTTIAYLSSLLFGQNQQASLLQYKHRENDRRTTKVAHAYFMFKAKSDNICGSFDLPVLDLEFGLAFFYQHIEIRDERKKEWFGMVDDIGLFL